MRAERVVASGVDWGFRIALDTAGTFYVKGVSRGLSRFARIPSCEHRPEI
jgi:hypothetical protein